MSARDHYRAHGRRRVDLAARLFAREGTQPEPIRIRDLGLGGACIELTPDEVARQAPLEAEASVTIEVTAPSLWDPLTLAGRVAWIRRGRSGRPARAGIRFEHRDAPAVYALFQLLGSQTFEA